MSGLPKIAVACDLSYPGCSISVKDLYHFRLRSLKSPVYLAKQLCLDVLPRSLNRGQLRTLKVEITRQHCSVFPALPDENAPYQVL